MSNIEITETTQNLKIEDAGIQTIAIVEDQVSIIKINEGAAAVALAASADTILGLSAQVLSLDTQAANLGLFGPVSGAAAAPTFRSLVDADFPATLNPTLAGLGATPIVTSYTGPHCVGGSPTSAAQFFVTGSFTSTTSVFGWGFVSVLTPANLENRSATGVFFGPTLNMVANRTHPVFATLVIFAPTIISASGASVTEATTLRILGAPTAGVSNYAINVVAGACRFGALTASLPVVTNADKVLTSLAYTGATSFRKNLGLETDDSPTFVGLTLSGLSGVGVRNVVVDANGVLSAP